MTTGFENVVETNYVAIYVCVGIGDRVPHTCLCREIDYNVKMVLLEKLVNEGLIRDGTFNEDMLHRGARCCFLNPG